MPQCSFPEADIPQKMNIQCGPEFTRSNSKTVREHTGPYLRASGLRRSFAEADRVEPVWHFPSCAAACEFMLRHLSIRLCFYMAAEIGDPSVKGYLSETFSNEPN